MKIFRSLESNSQSLAGKRILWVNSRPSAENLNLVNAFQALGINARIWRAGKH